MYASQYRAVTANDYSSLIPSLYANIDSVSAYGGEELDPPQYGRVYFSDYCIIHETHRSDNCDTRISIDTGLYIGKHKPHPDRMAEYSKSGIPDFGISTLIDPGQYDDDKQDDVEDGRQE